MEGKIYCKRIEFEVNLKNGTIDKKILLGIIEKEDDYHIYFRTKKNTYMISKKTILNLQPTDIEFESGVEK